MHIILENKSNKALIINLNGQCVSLHPFAKDFFTVEGNRVSLNLTTEDNYTSEPHTAKAGYYCGHRFITRAQYDFTAENDFALELYVETKKGDHFEAYQRVSPYCKDFILPEPIYTLKNEQDVKDKLAANKKLKKKAERRADFIVKADTVGSKIINIVMIILSLCLAALIFVAIYQNFSLEAAVIILVTLIFIGWLICKIIAKIINRIGKTADKFFNSKLFDKTMDKANEKFEEKYVYCKDMPEGLYKDESSFFDPIYISAVFKYSNKNI